MPARTIFLRISKFLGKSILGLLLVLLAIVAIIHLPPTQRLITREFSSYLSSKIQSRVEIGSITFSILGDLGVEDLKVWGPGQDNILSAQKIEVTSNIVDIISGDLIFSEVRISGVNCKLMEEKEGLNIQFIIDAFGSKEKQGSDSAAVNIRFNRIVLDNISVEYSSSVNGVTFTTDLGTFTSNEFRFSNRPNKISADHVDLQNTAVEVLSVNDAETTNSPDTSKQKLFSPDFGMGVIFEIKDLQMKDDDFSFHVDQVSTTPKFDPSHLDLKKIHVSLSDILIRGDTLATALQSLSAQLPGFELSDARTGIQLNRNRFSLGDLYLASNTNELHADLTGWYTLKAVNDDDNVNLKIAAQGRINPTDLSYFLSDSVMSHFKHWTTVELGLEGTYTKSNGDIREIKLKTENSLLHARGIVNDVWDAEKINWKDIVIDASIGSDVERTLTPWLRRIRIPPQVNLQLASSGNPKNIHVNGKVFTQWGTLKTTGIAALKEDNVEIDMDLAGEKVDLGKFMELPWLGSTDLSMKAKGIIGNDQDVEMKGEIEHMKVLDQSIHKIVFQSRVLTSGATASISINDPKYHSDITSDISFAGPLMVTTDVQLDNFSLGDLLRLDSALSVSGTLESKIKIDQSLVEGHLEGKRILLKHPSMTYSLDTMTFDAMISPTGSRFNYVMDDGQGNLAANFDIRNSPALLQAWSTSFLNPAKRIARTTGTRAMNVDLRLEKANLFRLLGIDVDFSSLRIAGEFDEQKQAGTLQATSGKFKGYGVALDTLNTDLIVLGDSLHARMNAQHLFYGSIQFGNLDFDVHTKGDTAIANLLLSDDSTSILGFGSRVVRSDSGVLIYPDRLQAFGNNFFIDSKNPIAVQNRNVVLDNFLISRDSIRIALDGDVHAFELSLNNVDLTTLNYLLSSDSTFINDGRVNAKFSYTQDQQIDLTANIDSLRLYNSIPLTVAIKAVSDKGHVPFEVLLTAESNKIDMNGQYLFDDGTVDASLRMDVNNLEIFTFLVSGFIDKMNGSIKGETKISGPIQTPDVKGSLKIQDASFTTSNPILTFNVQDGDILLDGSTLRLKDFTIYDPEHHPLTVNGQLTTKDYQSYTYDLKLHTDQYTLLNKRDSVNRRLSGLLVIGSDVKLTGNERDTHVDADVIIRDNTALTLAASSNEIKLLNSEGIIDFIDPRLLSDSTDLGKSSYFYDSLIASLPDFTLNSDIKIEDNASIRVNIDAQSGDFIEASGAATLELGYDRTGNVRLSGNYTIKKGVYRLSFYDLVKKNFLLVPGSSINWSGIPENGDLDIKAVYTVRSSSIGLMGDEVGDNEKAIYKRALPYDVGIIIKGTIENPVISFSLDLPRDERINYPVLATKLDRLKQPEFQSELNKQVFGVLVLGGFLPESSGSDINQNAIATTALSNSVNSLLSSQLNRFASQYIKGVDIDVGIQSYSDYAASGGKTQTAMDFRVTKRLMNDRLSFEIGGDFNLNQDQSGTNTGDKNFRGDIAIIYDLTEQGTKKVKVFNNETYDIIYQEIRNTGISLIFIREFDKNRKREDRDK